MGKKKKSFTKEFKESIIRLITEQGKSVSKVAEDVGIHENTLYRWVSESRTNGENAFPGKGNLLPEDDEIRKLKKRIADIEEENKILKKAISIFTKPEN